jgi:hypothetical protein
LRALRFAELAGGPPCVLPGCAPPCSCPLPLPRSSCLRTPRSPHTSARSGASGARRDAAARGGPRAGAPRKW